MDTIILGIDPGSRCTGYGVIKSQAQCNHHIDSGVIRPLARHSLSDRLHDIHQRILAIIETHKPHHVVVESTFLSTNPQTALKLGQARGCALLAAAASHLPIFEYSPRQIKQAITGYGAAIKGQVQHMVKQLLQLVDPLTEDQADALALALCHAHTHAFNQKIREQS
jgi:crossover junction endodeoxyribonuclease RuvC